MSDILAVVKLGPPPWPTIDPFLFCVHHLDHYPEGNERMGPRASLVGRRIGMDFEGKDGWRMYHGDVVPGFPSHPHRGFETITVARQGYIDHADSLGATARFGHGDVQWMTAGKGVVHSEMFPLVQTNAPNPTELFQIWLNLPRASKMVDPYFTMFWAPTVPRSTHADAQGRKTDVVMVAGAIGAQAPAPPPDSWAARPENHVAVWTLRLDPNAHYVLPAGPSGVHRTLYAFQGQSVRIGGQDVATPTAVQVRPDREVEIVAGPTEIEILMLQGRPIGEPVVQHGPFVMNTPGEIRQAMLDYQRTQFGGWPWDRSDPVHPRDETRFAIHANGRRERPEDVDAHPVAGK